MAVNYSVAVRNARADTIIAAVGASPKLRLFTGTKPTAAADPATGTLLAELPLPPVWLGTAVNGVIIQSGVWTTPTAIASGTVGYYRILNNAATVCHLQGAVPADLVGNPTNTVTAGVPVTVTGYTLTEGNA